MDFELKKLLHDEMGMIRIDLSEKIDEFWLSKIFGDAHSVTKF